MSESDDINVDGSHVDEGVLATQANVTMSTCEVSTGDTDRTFAINVRSVSAVVNGSKKIVCKLSDMVCFGASAVVNGSKKIANKLPHVVDMRGYVSGVIDRYVPSGDQMWDAMHQCVNMPKRVYENYINSLTYRDSLEYD